MSRFPERRPLAATLAALAAFAAPAFAGEPGTEDVLGRAATPAEIAAWDIDIRPDGAGLPAGAGGVLAGEAVYAERCAMCHGDFGEGVDRWPALAGGQGALTGDRPLRTIGSYWPYLSTVFDYIRRAMPPEHAQSLGDDDVYAVTAYLLYLNDIVTDEAFVLSPETFADIRLPNAAGFIADPRPDTPNIDGAPPCMTQCKAEVVVTGRAAHLGVTPEDGRAPGASAD